MCWFDGAWTPLGDAKVGIMTHAFLYGTATFEGIRAYWNEEHGQLYVLKMREHFERLTNSAQDHAHGHRACRWRSWSTLAAELLRRNGYREDAYIRPTLYKSTEAIGVRLHNLESKLNIFAVPFGEYISIDRGHLCGTVSWRRDERRVDPVARQDRRLLREPGVLQDARRSSTATTRRSC